jgi:hypothetical protein
MWTAIASRICCKAHDLLLFENHSATKSTTEESKLLSRLLHDIPYNAMWNCDAAEPSQQ